MNNILSSKLIKTGSETGYNINWPRLPKLESSSVLGLNKTGKNIFNFEVVALLTGGLENVV